ncbi:MAG: hypothetical protein EZS28_035663 [Streblomastix strix]|uniref:Uncharacterized protein n=1 Tax=Streblomastix strix TaxID=222440 RepID=A0A5J4UFC9_9EUKA|nr:MAG: hypothetical protein EZS28_035663 [Streblomastix strix]
MTRRTNFTNKRPTSRDSQQTPNYANLVPQNPLQVAEQPQPTFLNAFRQNLEIDPLDPDQTIATPEQVPSNAIKATRTCFAGLSGQETSQINFYAEEPSEEQVLEARQCTRAATDLVTRRKPPKHMNPPAQPMLAFDQVLSDLETKLMQQYRQLQGTLTKIVIRVGQQPISIANMTRALKDTTEQGNLLKTQPSPEIRPGNNNQKLRSLRALPQTEEAHPGSLVTLLTRIIGFTGELVQKLKNLTAQQVIDMVRSKPEIMPPEWAQDLARKLTHETQLTTFLPLLSQLQQQCLYPYAPLNPFYNHPPKQQVQRYQPPQYPFQYSGQPMQYPMQPCQFPVFLPPNPFLPTGIHSKHKYANLDHQTMIPQKSSKVRFNQFNRLQQAATQTVERPRQSTISIRNVHNMLIPPIPAYPQQQTPRILLLPYTTKRNQDQRQSQRSISPTLKRADESVDEEFLDEITQGMIMPHLPPYMSDIESAQRIWQKNQVNGAQQRRRE